MYNCVLRVKDSISRADISNPDDLTQARKTISRSCNANQKAKMFVELLDFIRIACDYKYGSCLSNCGSGYIL